MNMLAEHQLSSIEDRQTRQQFLKFYLQSNLSLVIAIQQSKSVNERVTELMNIPIDRVVPMPHLPSAVMGVYNWRGEILWIVDFSRLLGLKIERSPHYNRSLKPMIVLSNLVEQSIVFIARSIL